MTDPTRPPDDAARTDAAQADALDRYLDALARGERPATADLDPTLAATVRRAHAMGDDGARATTRRAGKARRWEDLMRTRAPASITIRPAIVPLPGRGATVPMLPDQQPVPTRLRRWGGRSMGLVATLALVLLVTAAGAGVYLTMPGGQAPDDTAPTLAGVAGGTPTAMPVKREAADPRLDPEHCTIDPLPYEQIMGLLEHHYFTPGADDLISTQPLALPLPDGPVPVEAVLEELDAVLVQRLSCQESLGRQAALSTDGGIVRAFIYRDENGGERVVGEWLLQLWSQQAEGIATTVSYRRLHSYELTEVRTLPDGRVAGYLTIELEYLFDETSPHPGNGYVVFAQQDGRWLVDDFRPSVIA